MRWRKEAKKIRRRRFLSYLGWLLSATPLCIGNAFALACLFSMPRKNKTKQNAGFSSAGSSTEACKARRVASSPHLTKTWLSEREAAEDRGDALRGPWVSSLTTTPVLSKGLFTLPHSLLGSAGTKSAAKKSQRILWQANHLDLNSLLDPYAPLLKSCNTTASKTAQSWYLKLYICPHFWSV